MIDKKALQTIIEFYFSPDIELNNLADGFLDEQKHNVTKSDLENLLNKYKDNEKATTFLNDYFEVYIKAK